MDGTNKADVCVSWFWQMNDSLLQNNHISGRRFVHLRCILFCNCGDRRTIQEVGQLHLHYREVLAYFPVMETLLYLHSARKYNSVPKNLLNTPQVELELRKHNSQIHTISYAHKT